MNACVMRGKQDGDLLVTILPIFMEGKYGVLEDVFQLQMAYFPLNHDYGRKGILPIIIEVKSGSLQ